MLLSLIFRKYKEFKCLYCGKKHHFSEEEIKKIARRFFMFILFIISSTIVFMFGVLIWGYISVQSVVLHFIAFPLACIGVWNLGYTVRVLPCFNLRSVRFIYLISMGCMISIYFFTIPKHILLLVGYISNKKVVLHYYLLFHIIEYSIIFLFAGIFVLLIIKTRKASKVM